MKKKEVAVKIEKEFVNYIDFILNYLNILYLIY